MNITSVKITPIRSRNGLVAFASIVLEDALALNSIAVYERRDGTGYRITFPTKKAGNRDCFTFRPITEDFSAEIAIAIMQKAAPILYKKEVSSYARHDNTHHSARTV